MPSYKIAVRLRRTGRCNASLDPLLGDLLLAWFRLHPTHPDNPGESLMPAEALNRWAQSQIDRQYEAVELWWKDPAAAGRMEDAEHLWTASVSGLLHRKALLCLAGPEVAKEHYRRRWGEEPPSSETKSP